MDWFDCFDILGYIWHRGHNSRYFQIVWGILHYKDLNIFNFHIVYFMMFQRFIVWNITNLKEPLFVCIFVWPDCQRFKSITEQGNLSFNFGESFNFKLSTVCFNYQTWNNAKWKKQRFNFPYWVCSLNCSTLESHFRRLQTQVLLAKLLSKLNILQ